MSGFWSCSGCGQSGTIGPDHVHECPAPPPGPGAEEKCEHGVNPRVHVCPQCSNRSHAAAILAARREQYKADCGALCKACARGWRATCQDARTGQWWHHGERGCVPDGHHWAGCDREPCLAAPLHEAARLAGWVAE